MNIETYNKMKTITNPSNDQWEEILKRPTQKTSQIETTVKTIFEDISRNGDKALIKYSSIFDNVILTGFKVTEEEVQTAETSVSPELKEAILMAKNNIEKFHNSQQIQKEIVETTNGVSCWQEMRPIEKVGLYIPGGTAPLFSTILMLGIPAKIAGCKDIVLCTPPNSKGEINPTILYTASLIGITEIYKIGGIQAIGALTYGTDSIPKVYKIFGPGNQFVTAAKQYALTQGVAIDMPAGPSELMVVADKNTNPSFVASDLLSQAEHGGDSQVILISESADLIVEVEEELTKQMRVLPRREIAEAAMKNSKLILMEDLDKQVELINDYAPEHLILNVSNEDFYLENVSNTGSVFIGEFTPESAGDYASGTNHTLPTNGYARMYSGVNLDAFTKKITFQKINAQGIQNIGPAIELMAEAEGLQAHKNAVSLRLESLK